MKNRFLAILMTALMVSPVFAAPAQDGLKSLILMATGGAPLSPDFASGTLRYKVAVQSDIASLEVRTTVIKADSIVSLAVNGKVPDAKTPNLAALTVGKNTLVVTVSDKNSKPAASYTIEVFREDIAPVVNQFLKLTFTDPSTGVVMPYRLFVPEGYEPTKSYPLVVFLHGGGERGDDNEKTLTANQGGTVWAKPEEQAKHPCFVLVPQAHNVWDGGFGVTRGPDNQINLSNIFTYATDLTTAQGVLDTVLAQYPGIDRKRLYLTGVSQGGIGTWNWNSAKPDLFAAMVPVCGAGDPSLAPVLVKKPIWAFHAADDPIIPVKLDRADISALWAVGGNPRYTEYAPGTYIFPIAHFSWVLAYQNAEMREWLFQQRLP